MPDQQQQINYGAAPNDGQGDPLRDAFIKTDDNFDAIWAAGPVGSNITILNNTVAVVNTNGNLVLQPNGVGVIQANASIVPDSANIRDLGSANRRWRRVYLQTLNTVDYEVEGDLTVSGNLTIQGDTIQIGNLVTDAKTLQLSNTAANAAQATGSGITVGASDNIATLLYDSGNNTWDTNIGLGVSGNVTADYFIGNGSALSGLPVPYTDTDVTTLLSSGNVSTDIFTQGNVEAAYILGNGSQLTGLPEQYGNANVANLLADFGSNNIVTTGNISGGQLEIAPGGGNAWTISGQNILAPSGGEWRSEDDSLDDFITSAPDGYINMQSLYADGNIASELKLEHGVARLVIADAPFAEWTFNTTGQLDVPGDIVPDANGVYSLGSESLQWANLWIANNTIYLGGVALGVQGNVLTVAGEPVLSNDSDSSITTTGNITANYFVGDGSQLTNLPGGGGNTGNVTFNDVNIIGTGNLNLQPDSGNNEYLNIYLTAGDDIHIASGTFSNVILGRDEEANIAVLSDGNVAIQAGNVGGTQTWNFGTDGALTLPGNTIAINYLNGNLAFGTVTFNNEAVIGTGTSNTVSGLYLAPDPGAFTDGMYLRVRGNTLSEATHIHFDTGNNQYFSQFIGDDNKYVELSNTGNIVINTNDYAGNTAQWTFGTDGLLTFPDGTTTTGDTVVAPDVYDIQSIGNTLIQTSAAAGAKTWTFGTDGNLTTPGGMIISGNINTLGSQTALLQPTDDLPLAFIASGANGSVISYWAEDIANSMSSNIAAIYTPLQNTQTVRIVTGTNGGNIAIYDFDNAGTFSTTSVSAAGNITGNYFIGDGSQLSNVNAVTVDVTDTNGLTTIYYPTFVENRTTAQIARADVDLTYRTDDNLLTVGNVSVTGNITAGNFIGAGSNVELIAQSEQWVFDTTGNLTLPTGGYLRVQTGIIGAGASPAPTLSGFSSIATTGVQGNISASGNLLAAGYANITGNINGSGATFSGNVTAQNFVGNISITGNVQGTSANVDLVAGSYTWTFNNTGNLILPANTFAVNYANGTAVTLDRVYLLEAYANVTYTLPGSFTEDPCRYSIISSNVNVSSSWFNTSTYTFTPQKAGYWEITASYDVYRNAEASMAIKKNNSIVASAGSFNAVAQQITKIIYLNGSTDYIDIVNVGGAALSRSQYDSRSWFQARWVGE